MSLSGRSEGNSQTPKYDTQDIVILRNSSILASVDSVKIYDFNPVNNLYKLYYWDKKNKAKLASDVYEDDILRKINFAEFIYFINPLDGRRMCGKNLAWVIYPVLFLFTILAPLYSFTHLEESLWFFFTGTFFPFMSVLIVIGTYLNYRNRQM